MKTTDCSVVQDLIPLALDNLVSEGSQELIRTHLETCKKCAMYMERIKEEKIAQTEYENLKDHRLRRALKRRRYEMLGMIGGIVFLVLLLYLLLFQPFTSGSGGENSYSVKEHFEDVGDYGKQDYKGIAVLSLFPDADALHGQIDDFYYDCKGSDLYQEYQIYLECSYEPDAYAQETERLLGLTNEKTGRSVQYSEEENDLPCVYAMLYDEGFEYVLLSEEEHKVIYIYLQGLDIRNLYFDRKYLPKDYGQAGYPFETEREAFRIYPTDQEEFFDEN